MSATARVSQSVNFGAGTIGGTIGLVSTELVTYVEATLAANDEIEIDLTVDVSAIKLAALEADKDCTVRTNANHLGSPDDTIALKAKQPLIWRDGDPTALFLTADVTKFFVTTGADETVIKFGAMVDATP